MRDAFWNVIFWITDSLLTKVLLGVLIVFLILSAIASQEPDTRSCSQRGGIEVDGDCLFHEDEPQMPPGR